MLTSGHIQTILQKAVKGDPWYGASTVTLLEGIAASQAVARPVPDVHSIWELLLHMTAWAGEVERRLMGEEPGMPLEGDWPEVSDASDEEWARAIEQFLVVNERVRKRIEAFLDMRWTDSVGSERARELGTGISHAEMVVGLLQHHAYHTGQIALVRKLVSASAQ